MSLTERFVQAITFCLARDGHGDLEDLARWALSDTEGEPPGDPMLRIALVSGGATRIKGYVFESARLPEIRGASGLLDRINREDTIHLWAEPEPHGIGNGDCVIYANGGEVLAFAPVTRAAWLADRIEQLYTHETLVAQSVAVWQSFTLNQIRHGLLFGETFDHSAVRDLLGHNPAEPQTFGSLVVPLALAKFRRREGNTDEGRAPRPFAHFETIPFARRCSSCERRAAVVNARVGDENRPLCEPCARKRIYGQLTKSKDANLNWWKDEGFDWQPTASNRRVWSWTTYFEDWLEEETESKQKLKERYALDENGQAVTDVRTLTNVQDVDEIGQASDPPGFIGMVYADGNSMGALLESLQTPVEYASFARNVDRATRDAVFEALAEHLRVKTIRRKQDEVLVHPFEILSLGGDDLLLVVPAHVAVPLACAIAENAERLLLEADPDMFDQRTEADGEQAYEWPLVQRCRSTTPPRQCKVSLSAGVVIADAHTPVFYLEELAGQLLKSAKSRAKRLRRECGYYGATVDFLTLKSVTAISGTVGQFRKAALTEGYRQRYARPYTIAETRALLEAIRLLKRTKFPRSQLYRLRESLQAGVAQGNVDYLYFLSRDREVRAARKEIEEMWTPAPGRPIPHPWRERLEEKEKWETIWFDLVELYDFVHEEATDNVS